MDEELLENVKALEKYDNGDDSEVEIKKGFSDRSKL